MLTGGQVADCVAGEALIELMPDARLLNGDEGYDSNVIRRGSGRDAEHPAKSQSALQELLLTRALPKPERHRAHVLPPQGLPACRDPLRQIGDPFPRRSLHRRHRQLPVMSLDPKPSD